MANGYPAPAETEALPECHDCGSTRFLQGPHGLRCEDCGAAVRDPFAAP